MNNSQSRVREIFSILLQETDSNSQTVQTVVTELENMDRAVVENEISNIIKSTATFKEKRIPIPIPIPIPLTDLRLVPLMKIGKSRADVWSSTSNLLGFIRNLAFKPLLEASLDPEDVVSYYSTFWLTYFREQRAVPFLIKALESPYAIVRINAVRALGELGDPQAISPLFKTLKDWWNLKILMDKSSGFNLKKYYQAVKEMGIDKNRGFDDNHMLVEAPEALRKLGSSFLHDRVLLDKMSLIEFSEFLTGIGFKQKIIELAVTNPTIGVIKLENADISYIVKDVNNAVTKLSFVIGDLIKRVPKLEADYFIDPSNPEFVGDIMWKDHFWIFNGSELSIRLNERVNIGLIYTGIGHGNLYRPNTSISIGRNTFSVEGNKGLETKNDSITISHGLFRLPGKEYFEAIEEVAHYIRESVQKEK